MKCLKYYQVTFSVDGYGPNTHKYQTKTLPTVNDYGYWCIELENGTHHIDRNRVSQFTIVEVWGDAKPNPVEGPKIPPMRK